ncbi:MAG: hypothetical protein Q7J82_03080 [Coriobacteriia bacterium]|nr:hypothetical protein [Coriobacteriia bacterium]
MDVLAFNGPLALFLQGMAFVLVVGALFMIVHALGRPRERWRAPWTRWLWVVLGIGYVVVLAAAFILSLMDGVDTTLVDAVITAYGFGFIIALVAEVAYLLRVVFPARREVPCPSVEAAAEMEDATTITPEAPWANSGESTSDTFTKE